MSKYTSTKTYGHDQGLSVCFRQHKAESHCRFLHGYALSFKFTFGCNELTKEGWVVDFGGLKRLKQALVNMYDHKLLVSGLDPSLPELIDTDRTDIADIRIVKATGCEAFAKEAWDTACIVIANEHPNAHVISCEVSEHGGNSAIYCGGDRD